MANVRITQLPPVSGVTGTEIVPVVSAGATKRMTAQQIADLAGGSSSLIQLASALSFTTIPEAQDTIIPLDPTVFGGAFYRLQGSDMAWGGAGNETKITILSTGYYTLRSAIVVTAGSEAYGVALTPFIDGGVVAYEEYGTAFVPTGGAGGITARVNFTQVHIAFNSVVEVHVNQVGNTSNDNGIAGFTVVLTKDA